MRMEVKHDLSPAEMYLGTIANPKRKRAPRTKPALRLVKKAKAPFCQDCGKHGFGSELAARQMIGILADLGKLDGRGAFTIQPYLCGHGWWHFGRNYHTLHMFLERAA